MKSYLYYPIKNPCRFHRKITEWCFGNLTFIFSESNLKTNFFSQSNIVIAFIEVSIILYTSVFALIWYFQKIILDFSYKSFLDFFLEWDYSYKALLQKCNITECTLGNCQTTKFSVNRDFFPLAFFFESKQSYTFWGK